MTLEELRNRKKETGYSNEMLAQLSGVPLSTVQKVMSGITHSPRRKTLEALASVLLRDRLSGPGFRKEESRASDLDSYMKEDLSSDPGPDVKGDLPPSMTAGEGIGQGNQICYHVPDPKYPGMFRESAAPYGKQEDRIYTIEDLEALPEGIRAELVDGEIYYMAAPSRSHQKIIGEMYMAVAGHIRSKKGTCEVYLPPFDVFVRGDDSACFQPDLTVVCDAEKLDEKGCHGAPDWVVEVKSPSSTRMDCAIKLSVYRKAGVREYWLIHPEKRMINVFVFGGSIDEEMVSLYSFDDAVPGHIFPDLSIRLSDYL